MASFEQFISSIRQEFGEQDAGKKFEVFCKWFLENDPEWSKKVDKVWLWDEYPDKWQRQDLGTDLVFKDNDGLVWAVQAKCYSEHRTTTKGDMNSFLADTGRPEVDRRLWLQTTNKIEAKAEKTYKGQEKHVTIINLNNFRDAQIDYPSSFADLYQAKVKNKPEPDPHQVKAIADVTDGLQKSDRGQMIMACGTGKTFTTLWIKEALKSETTLVLLPSLSLLSQTMREWAWAGNTDFKILNVCSDKSVGKKTEDMAPSDAPFAVTSDVYEIATFLRKSGPRVVFCTYQSSQLIAEAQIDTKVPTFDLAIADEAHRCAGKADAGFATILDSEKIRASKRLFTTATPRYFGKAIKDASKAADLAVIGMDDETVFGPVIHQLTFGQAIQDELLNDYQVVILGVDEPMVKQWIDNYEIVATNHDETTDARTLAAKIGMLKAIKDYDLKRVISFHSRVSGAKKFSEELTEVADLIEPVNRPEGTFLSDYVSGAMKAGDRKDKIDKLKELEGYDRGILTNARCLAEGVDVPSLDGVAFIDPKGSQVEIIQAVGRAIRKVRGAKVQTKGTIVIPVFIEDDDNHEASIEASNFKPVWDVLKALRAHDEVLADTLDQYRTNMAKDVSQARENISDKIVFDLPMSVDTEFATALRTVLVEASTASWEFWFGLLEQYKEREGHCRVPVDLEINHHKIGNWAAHQRNPKTKLSSDRKLRLDELGFVWDPFSEAWEIGFTSLLKFQRLEGHCNVPQHYELDGTKLGHWVRSQRKAKNGMSLARKKRLSELGFIWDVPTQIWEEGFAKLVQFWEEKGHCIVPQRIEIEGFKLGNWCLVQMRNKNSMLPERKQRLDNIGFIWSPLEQQWENGLDLLLRFKEIEGHCNVHAKYKINDFKLGTWVSTQRENQDNLSTERKQRLDDIGFVWDPFSEAWEKGFEKLSQFKETKGHCRVAWDFKTDELNLYEWVRSQRKTKDKMPPERKQRLDDIGFIWDVTKDKI
ncbi:Helicase associated domain protein [Planktomarina temperata]|nr:Helicase associated domain protein [Planktomarina temperata]